MTSTQPIEIIGGGLAGLSLGLGLRCAAVPTRIIEASDYPRHRVCGDFMTGLAPATIKTLGLAPLLADALQHHTVAWYLRGKLICRQDLPAPAFGLSRYALDARLAQAFVAAGGELVRGNRVPAPSPSEGRILAHGRTPGDSPWLGLKLHFRDLALAEDLELHLGDEAYVGLAKVETGAINLCGLFRRRALAGPGPALIAGYLAACGLHDLAARCAQATAEPSSFSAVSALSYAPHPIPTDSIRLGDAAGLIPPFTGNGMALAFQSAETALPFVVAYAQGETSWADTCRRTQAALHRRFRRRLAVARALHPFLLTSGRQPVLARLARNHLLPLRLLYHLLH